MTTVPLISRLILTVEEHTLTKYVGYYDVGNGRELYIFYQENPRTDLGHSNYLGVFLGPSNEVYFTNGKDVEKQHYPALMEDGELIFTRFTHDMVTNSKGHFLDGGISYLRTNKTITGHVVVRDGKEVYIPIHEKDTRTS